MGQLQETECCRKSYNIQGFHEASAPLCHRGQDPKTTSLRYPPDCISKATHPSAHKTVDASTPQEPAQRNNAASAEWSEVGAFENNGESLYDGGDDFWSTVAYPDWSNEQTAQRLKKPRGWCNGYQCQHPWPKDGNTFHVRSRRASAYLRSLQLAGDVPTINPLSEQPLAEMSGYRVLRDAHKMGLELMERLRGCASDDNSGGSCCNYMLIGGFLEHPGYASFQRPSNAQEFLSAAEGADPVTKWNEFFELVHKQHRDSFPAYYTPNTGEVPRYFYQRFPLLADQAQSASHDSTSDSQISSHGQPSSYGSGQGTVDQASRNRLASGRGGRRRHANEQRKMVMRSGRSHQRDFDTPSSRHGSQFTGFNNTVVLVLGAVWAGSA